MRVPPIMTPTNVHALTPGAAWVQVPLVKLPVKLAPLLKLIAKLPPEPNVALVVMFPPIIAPVVKLIVPTVVFGMYGVSPVTPVIVEPVRLRVPLLCPVDDKLPSMFVTDCPARGMQAAQQINAIVATALSIIGPPLASNPQFGLDRHQIAANSKVLT